MKALVGLLHGESFGRSLPCFLGFGFPVFWRGLGDQVAEQFGRHCREIIDGLVESLLIGF